MDSDELVPHLFRTEYRKIVAVLCKLFGFDNVETAEDIASETFLFASETWSIKGLPENPCAWLYTVAKNKSKNYLKRSANYGIKLQDLAAEESIEAFDLDLSEHNINDSQLQMIFAVCNPVIPAEAQIALALRILCGFGIVEIAEAFLSNKETINKRLFRAKEKLKECNVQIQLPSPSEIAERLDTVLKTLYLLFNQGYYSSSGDSVVQKDMCLEAMRLAHMLIDNEVTDQPKVNALMALMCFQASRLDARTDANGEVILYHDQDTSLWNAELIVRGQDFLQRSSRGEVVSKYHYEAGIAYWHTVQEDSELKWENILQLYNHLLIHEYSPIAALNRTYALSKVRGAEAGISEAEKLKLKDNHLYYSLLGQLYTGVDNRMALFHMNNALRLAKNWADINLLKNRIAKLESRL